MPIDWLTGDNPAALLTCLATLAASTAFMYLSARLAPVEVRSAEPVPSSESSAQEQAA